MKLLEGIRVIDMTNVLSGPFCTLHLALLGAEVIKIENPRGGDLARKLGCSPELGKKSMGTSFLAQNANKKSLTLNLKTEEGKEVFAKLIETADVLVENFRPDVLKRLGFPYEKLKEINPQLVYCAISGFGQDGPDAFKPAYDQIIQGLSGVMAINGDQRLNPLRCGFPVCDTVGGLNAAFAIMSALFHRERTGKGQFIDISLIDSIMPLLGWVAANLLIGGQQPVLMGNDNMTAAPSGMFKTKDGFINIAANEDKQWLELINLLELPDLAEDSRFNERNARKANRQALTHILEIKLERKETDYWVEALNAVDVPSGAILSLEDALTRAKNRGVIAEVDSEVGVLQLFNLTAKFSETPGEITTPPSKLGEHTNEILDDLGYSESDIASFKEKGAI